MYTVLIYCVKHVTCRQIHNFLCTNSNIFRLTVFKICFRVLIKERTYMSNMNGFAHQYHGVAPEGCVKKYFLKGTEGPMISHDIDEQRAVHICYIIFSRSTCLLVDILYVFLPKSTCYCHMTAFSQSKHRIFLPK